MVLVDTSVWIEHLRHGVPALASQLNAGSVLCHPFVIGELACGRLSARGEVLSLLANLPQIAIAEHAEVLRFVEDHALFGCGLGWVDAHLLASSALSRSVLWTSDRRLADAARLLGLYVSR